MYKTNALLRSTPRANGVWLWGSFSHMGLTGNVWHHEDRFPASRQTHKQISFSSALPSPRASVLVEHNHEPRTCIKRTAIHGAFCVEISFTPVPWTPSPPARLPPLPTSGAFLKSVKQAAVFFFFLGVCVCCAEETSAGGAARCRGQEGGTIS